MLKNYSDHTIVIKVGPLVKEIPAGWSIQDFDDDPEFEEFLRNRYPELKEPEPEESVESETESGSRGRRRGSRINA